MNSSMRFVAPIALLILLAACGFAEPVRPPALTTVPLKTDTPLPAAVAADTVPAADSAGLGSRVAVHQDGVLWFLTVNGEPYFIRGAGGNDRLDLLRQSGGNSIRTWGADNQDALLNQARRESVTVTIGIWLGHKEHGFSYANDTAVRGQYEKSIRHIARYRNHPALLMWAVGNEMEMGLDAGDSRVWVAVNDIARTIHELDPYHPVMTVVAEISDTKIRSLNTWCPDLDLLGVNSYGGCRSLPSRLRKAGWLKPYVVTEFGPLGPWESGKTSWGASFEPSSADKTAFYLDSYRQGIAAAKGWCLGSYVFLWGNKQEHTVTWFGMFLPSGESLGPLDAMVELWTGKPPAKRAPELRELQSPAEGQRVDSGSRHPVSVQASAGPLTYEWTVLTDVEIVKVKGKQSKEVGHPGKNVPDAVIVNPSDPTRATLVAPSEPGPYRLYVIARDKNQRAAMINFPFYVKR